MKFFFELKPLKKKYPESFEPEFSTAQSSCQCQLLLASPQALCLDAPHDTIRLTADRILMCLHGQNLEKWGYRADHFRSEFDPHPELVLPNISSLHEVALHGRHHSRNSPNVKQMWHSALRGETGPAGFVKYSPSARLHLCCPRMYRDMKSYYC